MGRRYIYLESLTTLVTIMDKLWLPKVGFFDAGFAEKTFYKSGNNILC